MELRKTFLVQEITEDGPKFLGKYDHIPNLVTENPIEILDENYELVTVIEPEEENGSP